MYKIAICDDDKNYREKIEKVIETEGILPKSEIRFYEYESGKELLKNADILHDLVFMDMRMPGLDGNKSVLKLREYNRAAILVFCSGYFEPTSDSINIGQPFRYIMKDLHDRSLKREIPAILSKVKLHCGDSSVTVTSAGRVIRIYTEDILYICLAKRGCSISPASIVGTRIVRECIKQGNDYIDPFGEGDVEKYIVDNKSMIGDKKTRIILSSGTYPGLSEALFKYVAEIHKGAEVSIKEYFYGNSYFSHGATQDVISSMINNKSKSMSFFYKDEIIPCKMRIGESICIDEKVGTMYLYPIISKDFRRVCKETGVKEGCFFNTFSDLSSMASFFEIGSKIYHSNSMDTFGYTEQLEKMYRNKSTENEKTIFWFGIELVNGNDVEKKLMSFEYACNWNSLSGYVCALVAEWCLNDEISKGKAYNLDEIEGIQKFIESLPGEIKQNIVKL